MAKAELVSTHSANADHESRENALATLKHHRPSPYSFPSREDNQIVSCSSLVSHKSSPNGIAFKTFCKK